jgi:hypothetical protein
MIVRVLVMCVAIATPAFVSAQDGPAAPHDGYAWAETCKDCHKDIYEAWARPSTPGRSTSSARATSNRNACSAA